MFVKDLKCPGSATIKIIGFGKKGHVPKTRNHRNEELGSLPQANRKVIRPKMKQNNAAELLSISIHEFTSKCPPPKKQSEQC